MNNQPLKIHFVFEDITFKLKFYHGINQHENIVSFSLSFFMQSITLQPAESVGNAKGTGENTAKWEPKNF